MFRKFAALSDDGVKFKRIGLLMIVFLSFLFTACKQQKAPSFDKLIFHTTICFGSCPVYHLEINKNKQLKLFAESVWLSNPEWRDDTTKEGYFTGIVSDTSFKKLSTIINTIGLDTVRYDAISCCDGPIKTIIMYKNGKRTYLRSMVLPEKLGPLLGVLYEICQNSTLKRAPDKFVIEEGQGALNEKITFPPGKK